ncbi:MAG: dipeptide/oligopeptide/nickel ABC transporter ATP-binding protein [Elusimicrobiota bacterium]|jgi:peptide/nickel transport system ATP-binding protein|nr:dipeptide/oligopeptide/nickel ABC transporter ATP-binding protein [Elusimicrobiota bacterium]
MFLSVKDLSKTYVAKTLFRKVRFAALDKINFCLAEGESLSLVGRSGGGKTTLGRVLARITDFDGGEVKYFDKNINDYGSKELSNIVQMVFQNPYASLNPKITIKSSLSEALSTGGGASAITQVLKEVQLDPRIVNNFPHQFSGGQRQRIAIARVLLKNPKLIIADEPFSSLDTYSQAQIMDIFGGIKRAGRSIILITHDIDAAKEFSDKILSIEDGKIGSFN